MSGRFLYVMEARVYGYWVNFSKVGWAFSPEVRAASLRQQWRRELGVDLVHFVVWKRELFNGIWIENEVKKELWSCSLHVPALISREYFACSTKRVIDCCNRKIVEEEKLLELTGRF